MSKRSLPWLQFYPSDWLSDSVAGCTLAAQGLWFRMLFVAHASQRYGYMEIDGNAIPDELMFRRCGCSSVEEYRNLLAELFSAGVPSRTAEGVVYSRRMARDQQERDATAKRVRRHRERAACNATVTPLYQREVRSQRSETEKEVKPYRRQKQAPGDVRHKPFLDFAYEAYKAQNKQPPTWEMGRAGSVLSRFLKGNLWVSQEEWEARFMAYLRSTDRYTGNKGDDSLFYFMEHFDLYKHGPVLQKGGTNAKSTIGESLAITLAAHRAADEQKYPS